MIRPAAGKDFDDARAIMREYVESLPAGHVCTQDFKAELIDLENRYTLILLAYAEGQPSGCVAMRQLGPATCELKRLYVRPAYRGIGLGRQLIDRFLTEARQCNYTKIRLDSMPEMAAAQALYRKLGFHEIPKYADNPEGTICMELALTR